MTGDIDKELLRLESMARDGIRPPISGLELARVALKDGRNSIVVIIPKSWNPPHQVVFQKDYRYYTRGSAGKQHIDVDELRRVILYSQEIGERIRQFRANRVASVISSETSIELVSGARKILHFVPLNAFASGVVVDLSVLHGDGMRLVRILKTGGSQRFNVDGLLAYSPTSQGNEAYAQIYRNGVMEIVATLNEWKPRGELVLPSLAFEEDTFAQVSSALSVLKAVGVDAPVVLMLSLVGIRGWHMGVKDPWGDRRPVGGFDRDPVLVPELVIQSLEVSDVQKLIKPIIDATWNAGGFSGSDYYDEQGDWVGERQG